MSYTEPDEPENPDRRALFGLLASVPILGGAGELVFRMFARPSTTETAKAGARAALYHEADSAFPFGKAAEVASDRQQQSSR